MNCSRWLFVPLAGLAIVVVSGPPALEASSQDDKPADATAAVARINERFEERLRNLERERLDALAELAASLEPDDAAPVYETLFRSALASEHFQEAEPIAERLLNGKPPSPVVLYFAEVTNILAEADRGAFEDSLESLINAVERTHSPDEAEAVAERALPDSSRLALLDLYYQTLVQADQFEIAKRACRLLLDRQEESGGAPEIRAYMIDRLRQLEMVGRPAPHFEGTTIDGDPIRLTDFQGDVVLLVFWASWHDPTDEHFEFLESVYETYHDQGFEILGINLDALADGAPDAETLRPILGRYLIDHNVRWPNLITTPENELDIAALYGVSEIPATVLINREGRVAHLDLTPANLERVLRHELNR